ncbi:hypothetical protein F4861DRAFT_543570 [Xylaria intraflava]|nr:hypothetical protein F4861DRAFT_543570 [Xylaria intraflava]
MAAVPAGLRVSTVSLPLPAGAILVASARDPVIECPPGHWLLATLASGLRLAVHYQQFLSETLWSALLRPILRQVTLLTWVVSHLILFISIQTHQAAIGAFYHSIRLSKQATWAFWNSKHMRRLKKKIEFEFFTLILGGGGNNLCLVIFWPGWGVLALGAFIISAWCSG